MQNPESSPTLWGLYVKAYDGNDCLRNLKWEKKKKMKLGQQKTIKLLCTSGVL